MEEGHALDWRKELARYVCCIEAAAPIPRINRVRNTTLHPKLISCSRAFCRMSDIFSRRTGTSVKHRPGNYLTQHFVYRLTTNL